LTDRLRAVSSEAVGIDTVEFYERA
jgi:hypothetical protein